jgi:ribose transport system substrate-binding protein
LKSIKKKGSKIPLASIKNKGGIKMKRKLITTIFSIALIVALVLVFSSCTPPTMGQVKANESVEKIAVETTAAVTTAGAETTAAAETTADPFKGKVIGIMASWMTHQWYGTVLSGFKDAADPLGITYNIVDSEGDVGKGVSIIEQLVSLDVDGILVFPGSPTGYDAGIEAAKAKNIPIVADVIYLNGVTTYGGNENFEMTRKAGKAAGEWIKKNWAEGTEVNVLTVNIPAFPNLNGRTDGFLVGLIESGVEYNWSQEVDGQGNITTALQVSTDALTANPQVNVIFGINDDSAFGGLEAAKQKGMDLSKMLVVGTGYEGEKSHQLLLDSTSPYKIATGMFPYSQGVFWIEIFKKIWAGETIADRYLFPSSAITLENNTQFYDGDKEKVDAVLALPTDEVSAYPMDKGWPRDWFTKDTAKYLESVGAVVPEWITK